MRADQTVIGCGLDALRMINLDKALIDNRRPRQRGSRRLTVLDIMLNIVRS